MMSLFKKSKIMNLSKSTEKSISKLMKLNKNFKFNWMKELRWKARPQPKEDKTNSTLYQLIWSKTWTKCLMNSYQSIFNRTWMKLLQLSRKMVDLLRNTSLNRNKCTGSKMTSRKSKNLSNSSKSKEQRSLEIVDAKSDRRKWNLHKLKLTHQVTMINTQIILWIRVFQIILKLGNQLSNKEFKQ